MERLLHNSPFIRKNFRDIEHALDITLSENIFSCFIFMQMEPFVGAPTLKFKSLKNEDHPNDYINILF
jgi:hypothetical protein